MNEAQLKTNTGASSPVLNNMPTPMRKYAAERKYAEAVELYASTDLSVRQIAKRCKVTATGLSAHLARHHRELLFARYGLDINDSNLAKLKVKPPKGQSLITHLKYKDAIEACGDIGYIELNVSQIARLFGVDGTALASQLRVHYPDVLPNRERMRQRLGVADRTHRGARPASREVYAEALAMYRDTDMTIPEVAEKCEVSKGGLTQYLRFYHKDIIEQKAAIRKAARRKSGSRTAGEPAGNGGLYGPKPATVARYAPAMEMYRNSSLTIQEISDRTGVTKEGFKNYLRQWHRDERTKRRSRKEQQTTSAADNRN